MCCEIIVNVKRCHDVTTAGKFFFIILRDIFDRYNMKYVVGYCFRAVVSSVFEQCLVDV